MPADPRLIELLDRVQRLEDAQAGRSLGNSSIDDAPLTMTVDGVDRAVWGPNDDGSVTTTYLNGPQPPRPSVPTCLAVPGGFRISWDGTFVTEAGEIVPATADTVAVEVHVELTEGFVATRLTRDATIRNMRGGTVPFTSDSYDLHYVRLVAVTESSVDSEPSDEVAIRPLQMAAGDLAPDSVTSVQLGAGAVTPSASATGTTGNLIPDSGFADAAWRDRRVNEQSGASWSIVPGTPATSVAQSGYYAQSTPSVANADTGEDEQSMWLLPFPGVVANPGERFYLGVWAARSTDGAGRWAPQAVFFDSEGRLMDVLTTSVGMWRNIEELPDASLGNYQMYDATITVPDTAAALGVRVIRDDNQDGNATTKGLLLLERAELRSIMTRSNPNEARVETGPNGINIVDPAGKSLGGIDEEGTGTFQSVTVAGSITVGGDDIEETIRNLSRGEVLRASAPAPATTSSYTNLLTTGFTMEKGRRYRIFVTPGLTRGSSAWMGWKLLYTTDGSTPTVSSPQLTLCASPNGRSSGIDINLSTSDFWTGGDFQLKLLLQQVAYDNVSGNLEPAQYRTNRVEVVVTDVGPDIGETASGLQKYTSTWYASWSRAWNAKYGIVDVDVDDRIYQGRTGINGDEYSVFGFNTADIRSKLAGAGIVSARLWMYCQWAELASGAYVRLRTSGLDVPPGNNIYPAVSSTRLVAKFAVGEGRWVDLPVAVAAEFQSGATKSFAIDCRDVAANAADHGRYDGAYTSGEPTLQIVYTK